MSYTFVAWAKRLSCMISIVQNKALGFYLISLFDNKKNTYESLVSKRQIKSYKKLQELLQIQRIQLWCWSKTPKWFHSKCTTKNNDERDKLQFMLIKTWPNFDEYIVSRQKQRFLQTHCQKHLRLDEFWWGFLLPYLL